MAPGKCKRGSGALWGPLQPPGRTGPSTRRVWRRFFWQLCPPSSCALSSACSRCPSGKGECGIHIFASHSPSLPSFQPRGECKALLCIHPDPRWIPNFPIKFNPAPPGTAPGHKWGVGGIKTPNHLNLVAKTCSGLRRRGGDHSARIWEGNVIKPHSQAKYTKKKKKKIKERERKAYRALLMADAG